MINGMKCDNGIDTIAHLLPPQDYYSFNNGTLVLMDHFRSPTDSAFYQNSHTLMMMCTRGKAQFLLDGRQVLLRQGGLFCSAPNSVMGQYISSPDFQCRIIAVSMNELSALQLVDKRIFSYGILIKQTPVVFVSEEQRAHLDLLFDLLSHQLVHQDQPFSQEIVRSVLATLTLKVLSLYHLYTAVQQKHDIPRRTHNDRITRDFVRLVENNAGRQRKVEAYAAQLNITPKYLSTIIRKSLGRKPTEIIHAVTIHVIEQRLRYTDLSIKEIANDLEFSNLSFFGKYVRQSLGVSPMEYRHRFLSDQK